MQSCFAVAAGVNPRPMSVAYQLVGLGPPEWPQRINTALSEEEASSAYSTRERNQDRLQLLWRRRGCVGDDSLIMLPQTS
jgi:hypothetical protein